MRTPTASYRALAIAAVMGVMLLADRFPLERHWTALLLHQDRLQWRNILDVGSL
jgi:hypothetical protein